MKHQQREKFIETFSKFLPSDFVEDVVDLFIKSNVKFSIVKKRSTKLGDFRASIDGQRHQITVNGDLNPYSFLITTLHEFAHLITFEKFGRKVAPHGEEWKNEFRKLLLPVIQHENLPQDIRAALHYSYHKTKASSCTDHQLSKVLMQYDKKVEGKTPLYELNHLDKFSINNRVFEKGELRRKRYVCKEISTNKMYLISSLANVEKLNNEK